MAKSKAVEVVKGNGDVKINEPVTLSTGYAVILRSVPPATVQSAVGMIDDPPVPMHKMEGKNYETENRDHPDYIRDCQAAQVERMQAGFDVMTVLGIELVESVPDNAVSKLKMLGRLKRLNIADYNLDDPDEIEFLFKKYIAMGAEDWNYLAILSGVTEGDLQAARESFRSKT